MKKLLLTLVLAFMNTSAMAEWTLVEWIHEDGGLTLYVDYITIRKVDNKVKMLSLVDFKVVEKGETDLFSSRTQAEFDCEKPSLQLLTERVD